MNRRTRKVLSVFIPLTVTVLACTCLPSGPDEETPEPVRRDTPLPPLDILFEDDFGDTDSGWEVGEYESGSVGYKSGVYFVTALGESIMWGVASRSFNDTIIEVDTTQISAGPDDNNSYGVICREQGDEYGSGYYLLISGDGGYAIYKAEGEDLKALKEWAESSTVRQGNAPNHMRVICDGSTLALFVNGQRLAEVEDSTFTRGDIAFVALSLEDEPTEIHFDNLVVRKP